MNNKKLVLALIGLALLLALVYVVVPSQQAKKTEVIVRTPSRITGFEIIDIGSGRAPRFSPDSKKVAFLSGGWLCLANSDGTGQIQKIGLIKATDFQWMDDSTLIYWWQDLRTNEEIVGSVSLKGEKSPLTSSQEQTQIESHPIFLPDGTIGFYKKGAIEGTETFKVIKEGALPPDSALKQLQAKIAFENAYVMYGDIWLVSVDGAIKKRITTNKRFAFPELSPDGKKILAHKIPGADPYLGQGDYVVDLLGNETYIGDPDKKIPVTDLKGRVVASRWATEASVEAKWSPNGSKIVYLYQRTAIDVEDIDASDIVIKNADGTSRFQMETTDEMEEEPVWSPDGTMIACQTYKTNKIRIFKLK
ncbi:MAG: hypothetical protein MUP17_10940 [candidate division Zixibacteria bacterium]|nr:hypothetical protein [candidate division Zixibacteria bacterium]